MNHKSKSELLLEEYKYGKFRKETERRILHD